MGVLVQPSGSPTNLAWPRDKPRQAFINRCSYCATAAGNCDRCMGSGFCWYEIQYVLQGPTTAVPMAAAYVAPADPLDIRKAGFRV